MKNEKQYPHTRPFLTTAVRDGHLVLRVRQATTLGYAEVPHKGCFDPSYPNSPYRRARTISGGNLANALTASGTSILCIFLEYE